MPKTSPMLSASSGYINSAKSNWFNCFSYLGASFKVCHVLTMKNKICFKFNKAFNFFPTDY